jgi:Protein of unknown function (DUF2877)
VKGLGTGRLPLLFLSPSQRFKVSASSVGFDVAKIVARANGKGMVHSCFSRAVNILFAKNEIVSVVDQRLGKGPFSVVVDFPDTQTFDTFYLRCGDHVSVDSDFFLIADGLEISTGQSEPFVPRHDFTSGLVEISDIRKNIKDMKGVVAKFGKFEGFHSIVKSNFKEPTPSVSGVRGNISSLIASIENDDPEDVRACCRCLLGLGLGLTPSADDLLCGLMLAYFLFTENLKRNLRKAAEINKAILHYCTQTTTLSQNYLRQAAAGNGTELTETVIESLLTSKIGSGRVARATIGLLSLGSTSGTDTAIGIMLGSILALRKVPGFGTGS